MDGDPAQHAPVVLVVVNRSASDPDLAATLAAAAAQDHPNVRLVVVSADDSPQLPALVGAHAAGAVVRQAPGPAWLGELANEVLRLVEGDPAFFCFVRDGVALAPDAVAALVREAYRSNAGVAGPKLVDWEQPDRLVSVGLVVDKFGERAPVAQPGELDQEQHDAVRDVFAVEGSCLFVRGDLLRGLGGFDPALDGAGEDLDLCWRAHVAGARVLVVPEAVARRRPAAGETAPTQARRERNRVRTMLTCYGRSHLLRVVPQALVVTLLQVVANVVGGRFRRASAHVSAWTDALRRSGELASKRRAVAALRAVPDVDVRRLQMRGSAALLRQFRRVGTDDGGRFSGVRTAGRQVATGVRRAERSSVVALGALAAVVAIGARALLLRRVPVVGELVPAAGGARDTLSSYVSGWWDFGVGRSAPVPTGEALVGLATAALGGHPALVRTLLVVGPFVVGPWGAWRLARPFRSGAARVAALVSYAAVPLAVNASSGGRGAGLLVWAATPWAVARIARLLAEPPFVARYGAVPAAGGLALLVAAVASLAPSFLLVPPLVGVALAVGSVVAGGAVRAVRALAVTIGATAAGAVLLLPWPVLAGGRPGRGLGRATLHGADGWSAWSLARFATGQHGRVGVGALVAIAALAGLAVARGERGAWAQRGVVLGAAGLVTAWLASRGSLGARPPTPETFLAPAAAGFSLAVAAGAAEFERALRGARFSWRQPVVFVAGLGVAAAALPTLGVLAGGRLGLPSDDLPTALRVLPPVTDGAAERLVWVGRPSALPGGGWVLGGGLAYQLTSGREPGAPLRWPEEPAAPERDLGDALALAADGQTDRLGHLLGPAGVRFVVVRVEADTVADGADGGAPAAAGASLDPLGDAIDGAATGTSPPQPATLLAALAGQLDLRLVTIDDPRLVVYENTAWIPVRAQLPATVASASRQAAAAALVQADLTGATPVLTAVDGATGASGDVAVGTVYTGIPLDGRWALRTADGSLEPEPAFGWASSYAVGTAGPATLTYRTSPLRWLAVLVQLAAWLVVAGVCLPRRAPVEEASDTLAPAPRRVRGVSWDDDAAAVPVAVGAAGEPVAAELEWGGDEPSWVAEGEA